MIFYKSYLFRFREKLGFRTANRLAKHRALASTSKSIDAFFELLEKTVDELGLCNKPGSIYNCDETNLSSCSTTNRVFCSKGESRVNKLVCHNEKINFTVQVNNFKIKFKFKIKFSLLTNH